MGDLQRDGDLHAEFQRLIKGPPGERHAGDAGGEAEIILDARGRAGLSAKGAGIEHDHRQTFRSGIDRSREPSGARADDRHVIDKVGIEIGRDAEARSGLCVGRPFQHGPVGAEHQRQIFRQHADTLHHGAALRIVRGVQHGMRIAVAAEKVLQTRQASRAGNSNQYSTGASVVD